jgi:hypothetical protein
MDDLLYYIVAGLGLLFFGGGIGALLTKKRIEKKVNIKSQRPERHASVAPEEYEIKAADNAATETDAKLKSIFESEEAASSPHPNGPDPGVVSWLKDKSKDEGNE